MAKSIESRAGATSKTAAAKTKPKKINTKTVLAAGLPKTASFLERQEQTLELVQQCKTELTKILAQKEQYAPRIDAVASALYKCNEIETSIYTKGSKQDDTETKQTYDAQTALYVGILESTYCRYLAGELTEEAAETEAFNFAGACDNFNILWEMAKVNAKAINNGYVGELLGGVYYGNK